MTPMSDSEVILHLSALAFLVSVLAYLQGRRVRERERLRRQLRPAAEPINVATLHPRVAAVRQDFKRTAQKHSRCIRHREGLITTARQHLAKLGFFRHTHVSSDGDRHAA